MNVRAIAQSHCSLFPASFLPTCFLAESTLYFAANGGLSSQDLPLGVQQWTLFLRYDFYLRCTANSVNHCMSPSLTWRRPVWMQSELAPVLPVDAGEQVAHATHDSTNRRRHTFWHSRRVDQGSPSWTHRHWVDRWRNGPLQSMWSDDDDYDDQSRLADEDKPGRVDWFATVTPWAYSTIEYEIYNTP